MKAQIKFEDTLSAKDRKGSDDENSIDDDELMALGEDTGTLKNKNYGFGEKNGTASVKAQLSDSSSSPSPKASTKR